MVPRSFKFSFWMNSSMVHVRTKCNNIKKGSIYLIIVLTPTLITSFKLIMKCDTKINNVNKTPNIKTKRKWSCKIWPSSQCHYHIPLTIYQITMYIFISTPWHIIWITFIHYIPLKTSSTHPLLDIRKPPNYNKNYPFLVWFTSMATIRIGIISQYHTQYSMIGHSRLNSLDL
jgi:hypothetical protein